METVKTSLLDQRLPLSSSAVNAEATQPQGHVSVNERVPNQRFSRYVDERLREWIRTRDLAAGHHATEYEVAFYDEEALGEVSCLIVVQSGPQLWRAWESADNQREALERSLENLRVEDFDPLTTPAH